MGRKCSVVNWRTNYRKRKKDENNPENVTEYSFPKNLDDRKAWVRAIPNENLSVEMVTDNMGVCTLHFKDCKSWRKASRFPAPDEPPTHFPDVPKSKVGTKRREPHSTKEMKKKLMSERGNFFKPGSGIFSSLQKNLRPWTPHS